MGDEGSVSVDRPRTRQTKLGREGRTARIVKRLRDGWAPDEVARQERLTVRRVQQIVADHLKKREAVEGVAHAHMQTGRVGWAMQVAAEAMAKGDIRAVGTFMSAVDRLDRYQTLAQQRAAKPELAQKADAVVMAELRRRMKEAVKDEALAEARAELAAAGRSAPAPKTVTAPSETVAAPETVAAAPEAVAAEAPSAFATAAAPLSAALGQTGGITNFFPFARP